LKVPAKVFAPDTVLVELAEGREVLVCEAEEVALEVSTVDWVEELFGELLEVRK